MKRKVFSEEFKKEVVAYHLKHPELSQSKCGREFGVSPTTVVTWTKKYGDSIDKSILDKSDK